MYMLSVLDMITVYNQRIIVNISKNVMSDSKDNEAKHFAYQKWENILK